jgi:hypothetical protein
MARNGSRNLLVEKENKANMSSRMPPPHVTWHKLHHVSVANNPGAIALATHLKKNPGTRTLDAWPTAGKFAQTSNVIIRDDPSEEAYYHSSGMLSRTNAARN